MDEVKIEGPEWPKDKEILLDDFALRSFCDIADQDYIAARLAYRSHLTTQFLWLGLQAVEKYLKCILLLNRIKGTDIGHHLELAYDRINEREPFRISLSKVSLKIMRHLDTYGKNRYFEFPFYVEGLDLIRLDRLIWEIRRYCFLPAEKTATSGSSQRRTEGQQKEFEDRRREIKSKQPVNGLLGEILANREHPARAALIWENACFGNRWRPKVRSGYTTLHNSPLSLCPELLEDVQKYVYLPGVVKEACKKKMRNEDGKD